MILYCTNIMHIPITAPLWHSVIQVLNYFHMINNYKNVKYAAINIINNMTIVVFGTKSCKILFTVYISEFQLIPLGIWLFNLQYNATNHRIKYQNSTTHFYDKYAHSVSADVLTACRNLIDIIYFWLILLFD